MCGSGTFLLEAAGLALNRAPGLTRERWGFEGWSGHDPDLFKHLYDQAWDAQLEVLPCLILGADRDGAQVSRALANLERAALDEAVRVIRQDWEHLEPPGDVREAVPHGLVVINPPYGERMEAETDLDALYASLGDRLRRTWLGWTGWILAGSTQLAKRVGLRPARRIELRNGPLDCRLLEIPIRSTPVQRDLAPPDDTGPPPDADGA
jgi:23S rRNA G2445 N2-methylase RlmL